MEYRRRTYRARVDPGDLRVVRVRVAQTDLMILAETDVSAAARALVRSERRQLHAYRRVDPSFFEALQPHDVAAAAPEIVRCMADVARAAGVGPMAAVAGAIAERVGRGLSERSREIVVENGGDIYLRSSRPRLVGIFAGRSRLSGRIALRVECRGGEAGVACSSATVGPSLSFGAADAAVVIADTASLADAVATGLGNRVRYPGDLTGALGWAMSVAGVRGALVILGEHLGAQGQVEIVEGPARDEPSQRP